MTTCVFQASFTQHSKNQVEYRLYRREKTQRMNNLSETHLLTFPSVSFFFPNISTEQIMTKEPIRA